MLLSEGRTTARSRNVPRIRILLLALAILDLPACSRDLPPNVVMILIDTLRADHIGCYGYRRPTTPNIDALAAEGYVFEAAIAQSSWTGPSVASLFTSTYPSRHGMTDFGAKLETTFPTLAGVMRQNGYRTLSVSANFTFVNRSKGLDRDFDHFEVLSRPPEPGEKPEIYGTNSVAGHEVTDRAIAMLTANRSDPFFLYVHYMDPHSSYDPPSPYRERFAREYDGPIDGSTDQLKEIVRGNLDIDDRDLEQLVSLYDGEVAYVDAEVGRLLSYLREIGAYANSVIVLLSDHGEEFMDHGGLFHMFTLYREQIRVPLILREPGGKGGGTRVQGVVELIDVGPTLLELAGIDDPRQTSGVSLLNASAGAPDAFARVGADAAFSELHSDPLVAEVWRPKKHRAAMTTNEWALLAGERPNELELYDAATDPLQEVDRAGGEASIVDRLNESLRARPSTVWERRPAAVLTDEEEAALRGLGYAD